MGLNNIKGTGNRLLLEDLVIDVQGSASFFVSDYTIWYAQNQQEFSISIAGRQYTVKGLEVLWLPAINSIVEIHADSCKVTMLAIKADVLLSVLSARQLATKSWYDQIIVLSRSSHTLKDLLVASNYFWPEKHLFQDELTQVRNQSIFYYAVADIYSQISSVHKLRTDTVEKMNKVAILISQDLSKNYCLKELTLSICSNETFLKTNFKKVFGQTVIAYQHKLRMSKAKYYLSDDKLTLQQIAGLLGYKYLAHFSSAFKVFSGVSPKVYREQMVYHHI